MYEKKETEMETVAPGSLTRKQAPVLKVQLKVQDLILEDAKDGGCEEMLGLDTFKASKVEFLVMQEKIGDSDAKWEILDAHMIYNWPFVQKAGDKAIWDLFMIIFNQLLRYFEPIGLFINYESSKGTNRMNNNININYVLHNHFARIYSEFLILFQVSWPNASGRGV